MRCLIQINYRIGAGQQPRRMNPQSEFFVELQIPLQFMGCVLDRKSDCARRIVRAVDGYQDTQQGVAVQRGLYFCSVQPYNSLMLMRFGGL